MLFKIFCTIIGILKYIEIRNLKEGMIFKVICSIVGILK